MSALYPYLQTNFDLFQLQVQQPKITTRIRNYLNGDFEYTIKTDDEEQCFEYLGTRSDFGPSSINIRHGNVFIFSDETRLYGCEPYSRKDARSIRGKVVLISRGKCPFIDKVMHAQQAGAKLVIFLNNQQDGDDRIITTTSDKARKVQIPSLMISQKDTLSLVKSRRNPLTTFSIKQLPSIDDDLNATISLLYLGQKLKNVMILNV